MNINEIKALIQKTFENYTVKIDSGKFYLRHGASIELLTDLMNRNNAIIYNPNLDINFDSGIKVLELDEAIDEQKIINWLKSVFNYYKKGFNIPEITYHEKFVGGTYFFDFYSDGKTIDTLSFDSEDYNKNKSKVIDILEKHKKELERSLK
jgi:hypothetical protein